MASAIVILNEPPAQAPGYNRVEICAEETDATSAAMTNYKFVIDVVITNHDTERFYVDPEPSSNAYGIFNANRHIEQYLKERVVNPDEVQSVNGFYQGENEYVLEVTFDVYSGWDVASTFTVDPDGVGAVSSTTIYVWSGSFEHSEWIYQMNLGSPFNTWVCNITNGTSGTFLSNAARRDAHLEHIGWTYYLTDTLGDIDQMEIKTYDGADGTGSLVGTFVVDNTAGSSIVNRLNRIASAPDSLNNIPGGQISTGAQPIIPSSGVASYTIQLQNSVGTVASEIITFNVTSECRYPVYRIHFLNELGGWDQYNFTSRSVKTSSVTRKSYTKHDYLLDASTGIIYSQAENGKSDYSVKYRDKVKLKSDFLTDAEQTWLKELITSPKVFLEFTDTGGTQNLRPVYVTANSWKELITEHDKLFQLEINIEYGHQNVRQRG